MTKSYEQVKNLVVSLDPGEKRFFRDFARRRVTGEANDYLLLFEAMAGASGDQGEFGGDGAGKPSRQLTLLKNYLLQMLLQSLRRQHRGKSLGLYLREQLDYIELLFRKGQGDLCLRLIARTKKKAQLLDEPLTLLELIRWEKRLCRWQAGSALGDRLPALVEEETACLEALRLETSLQGFRDQMFTLIVQRANPRLPEVQAQLEGILAHPLVGKLPACPGMEASLAWHFIHVYALQMRGEYQQVLPHYRAMFRIWEDQPEKRKWEEQRYINTLYLYLDNCLATGELDEFESSMAHIRKFRPQEPKSQALQFHFLVHLRLRHCLNTRSFREAMELEGEVQEGLRKHEKFISPNVALGFHYNLSMAAFILEDFSRALRWLTRIIHHKQISVRQDLQSIGRILLPIFHFELGNADLLQSLIPSSRRYLARRSEAEDFEGSLLKWLGRLSRCPEAGRRGIWREFRSEMAEVVAGMEVGLVCRDEIMAWLDSRCEGRPIQEVLQAK